MAEQERFDAFTVKSNGLLRVIKTKARIRPAQSIIDLYKLPQAEAEVEAIWDTGATNTSISSHLAQQLNLKPVGKVPVSAAGSRYLSNVYMIDIWLPNRVIVKDVRVAEAKNIQESEILVGMDIICLGDFSITNCDQQTCCSFRIPAGKKHIDYVAVAQSLKREAQKKLQTRQQFKKLTRSKRKGKKH